MMGGLGLIVTVAGKSSKIEARPGAIQGEVGAGRQLGDGASDTTNQAMVTSPCLF